jgi:hypothetical protein
MNKFDDHVTVEIIMDVYDQMKNNPNLAGSFRLVDNVGIEWQLFDSYIVYIGCNYINIDRLLWGKIPYSLTHWHPEDDELYEEICALGTKGNVAVVKKSWFCTSLLYMGPVAECTYKRKWLFGKYYYLYAD